MAGRAEFSTAMGDLKGLKPLNPATVQAPPAPPAPALEAAPMPAPAPPPPQAAPAAEAKEPGPAAPPQVQINLAAGMAIVVDGSLDLKGHALRDAEERLKERILDGYALGWRTLHVQVGASPELRQMVLDLLMSPAGRCVARYAQAPVPMGGAQAWILYFRGPGAAEN
jgi:DNA-nicking Smr family endonuclease